LMQRIDENQVQNARQWQQGEDLLSRLLGYSPYRPLGFLKANVTKLETELKECKVSFDCKLGVTKKLDKLKL
jgi:hypothetical protein